MAGLVDVSFPGSSALTLTMFNHIDSFSKLIINRLTMQLIKIILCCCCVFTGHFSNGSSINSSEIKSHLINHTMELIDRDFANNSNPLIIFSDLVDDQVASRSIDNGSPLIVIINHDLRRKQIEGYLLSYPTYILRFESMQKLVPLIFGFMGSTIWNIKSPIFILDISEGTHDENASMVLAFLGSLDILVSYYVDLKSNYKNIYFDKTQQLGGHEIKLMVPIIEKNLSVEYNQKNIIEYMEYIKKHKDNNLN
ncbi:Protein of unknown function [Cotesia congregata]|uniref:Uncharacterized protein n=1 Tax=Cotesia congregata TaxID=51543 RepID=A0A8J2HE44_COTCN|nr:Protein of unknown function [Cotesia congregata]